MTLCCIATQPTDDADMADREGEGEGERGYLQQVEETARHLRQSREGTGNTDKQGAVRFTERGSYST